MNVWVIADVSRAVPGGMRRHMELHALGLVRAGHRARTIFSEDLVGLERLLDFRALGTRSYLLLRDRYRTERPDVVNVHTWCAPAWILARRAGLVNAKIVVMSYAADEPAVPLVRPRDLLQFARFAVPARTTFPLADGIWCVNQADVDYYVGRYGVAPHRVARFPHAVADGFYAPEPQPLRRPRQVLFVGTWIHRKGVDVLAAALKRVVVELPDIEVVIAGTVSDEQAVVADLAPDVAARTRVIPLADDDTLRALYRESALLLLPSRREGLPITMLEAMASGCPPLAAANSGMVDVIRPGKNGWLESSFDPSRWAARVVEILRNEDGLAAASRGARQNAEAFRVNAVAAEVARFYQALER